MTVPSPTLSVTSVAGAIKGQVINLSDLVTISDPGFVGYQKLELWDSRARLAGGQFVVNGMAQTGGHEIDVSPANVANTVFDAGTAGGTDTLLARSAADQRYADGLAEVLDRDGAAIADVERDQRRKVRLKSQRYQSFRLGDDLGSWLSSAIRNWSCGIRRARWPVVSL